MACSRTAVVSEGHTEFELKCVARTTLSMTENMIQGHSSQLTTKCLMFSQLVMPSKSLYDVS